MPNKDIPNKGLPNEDISTSPVLRALGHIDTSIRLRAALAIGTAPDPGYVEALVARCGVEPEFSVRENLTWALTRHSARQTVPLLVAELGSDRARARSQALHTLSKIGDRAAWPAITRALLTDADDEVAMCAWRAAVVLVPEDGERELAEVLATQFGRGDRRMRLGLSRAVIALGEAAVPSLRAATAAADPDVREHALATERLARDPDAGFGYAVEEAKRVVALGPDAREE
ncbi:HEAT repeat domain-containing protein [Streptomyces sp. NPDC006798]|uniref:HEAT repeat domain-containing protein n=1 Tax=Streptomyces sp. NPDC006798 TaxID=3155462 RepID=UPI0033DAD502